MAHAAANLKDREESNDFASMLSGTLPKKKSFSGQVVQGRIVNGVERWANQTDTGQNRLSPGADRWKERSRTYPGIADAIAAHLG